MHQTLVLLVLFLFTSLGASEPYSRVKRLKDIPLGETSGLVVSSSILPIPDFPNAYNPSIIPNGPTYLISFRDDQTWTPQGYTKVKVGMMLTDLNFQPLERPVACHLGCKHVSDPRLIVFQNTPYLLVSNLTKWGPPYECCQRLCPVNKSPTLPLGGYNLQYKQGQREKNWVPFVYCSEAGQEELYYLYEANPCRILKQHLPIDGSIELPFELDDTPKNGLEAWETQWGKIRGGTPALKIGDEYLTFFHSSFKEGLFYWYVMGALTFESTPPFRLKRISPYPILCHDMYITPVETNHNPIVRACFAGGFVFHGENLHILAGENDSAIRRITLNTQKLLESLRPIE